MKFNTLFSILGRQLAAVMLRRLLSTEFTEFFKNLNEEQKAQFKTQVLSLLQNEGNAQMRRKIVDLVAEVSRNLMDDDGKKILMWQLTLKVSKSQNKSIKSSFLPKYERNILRISALAFKKWLNNKIKVIFVLKWLSMSKIPSCF